MNPLYRYALYVLLAVGLVLGGLAYRSHVYDAGVDAGRLAAQAAANEARLLVSRADALAAERAAARTRSDLQSLKDQHDRTTGDLKTALATANLRAVRLDARIASLLDQAAGVRAGPPADPGEPRGSLGTPEGDSTVEALIETTNENLAICRRNAARLDGIQEWYQDLREGRAVSP
ncbi:hypothetical protein [Variovorax paradoxus]|uniref:hypothetical protein n=1 Tax=Variovorax paradoxus TaxID=34073 RepID=UPI0029C72ED3|nr:hypothetical protein [Variovorax paradoxus]WPH18222.1 hypothetical protein RZE78_14385 [Variovorax paradoxus]